MIEFAKTVHQAIGIESPRLFILVFALIGTVIFGGLGWMIDRGYRVSLRQHAAVLSNTGVDAAATTPPPSALHEHRKRGGKPPRKPEETNAPKSPVSSGSEEPRGIGSGIPGGGVNISPNSVVSIGQQGGITAGTVNIGTPPPRPLVINATQSQGITDRLRLFSGKGVGVWAVKPMPRTREFASKLASALSDAGLTAEAHGVGMLLTENGIVPPSGLYFAVGGNMDDLANAIIHALGEENVIEKKNIPGERIKNPNTLEIYITP